MSEIFILIGLVILNGLFSMSEMALVSARKIRLEQLANQGNGKARAALKLIEKPDIFLSTIQIGITLISLITGLYSGDKFGKNLEPFFAQIPVIGVYAAKISVSVIVILVTFLSIILGELIPKKIALNYSERVALAAAPFMTLLSRICFPLVWFMNAVTSLFFKTFKINDVVNTVITEEEIKAMVKESSESGEIDQTEQQIIERVFHLGDRSITSLMTHRNDIDWLEYNGTVADVYNNAKSSTHNIYPICDDEIDELKGIIQLKDILNAEKTEPLKKFMRSALFVPENNSAYQVMEKFKQTKVHSAFIVDEYGSIQGMITLNDILEAIVGDIPEIDDDEYEIIQRNDGSYLVDAQLPFYDFLKTLKKEGQWMDEDAEYDTLGGFVIDQLKHIPTTGETFDWNGYTFEIIDMDGARIDKILVYHTVIEGDNEEA